MAYLEKKIKFLATKLSSLQAELQVSREIMAQASKDVDAMFTKKYFPEVPVEPKEKSDETELEDYVEGEEPEEGNADNQEEEQRKQHEQTVSKKTKSAEKNADPEVKKLFRKIASITHPDKLSGLSEYERGKKEELFKKAMTALENNDLVCLADVAMELDLETPDLSKEKLKQTEQKIITIKRELNQIESTFVWKWFFCEDEEEKQKILETLFGIMYAHNRRS
jgi:hypothetical protein